ncbi:hypothetical protein AGMMS50230_01430 [Spirochaetia bacterium]|nr:hypothetical protein AGMMS50230_01430 [Spirochaetia bacterium]
MKKKVQFLQGAVFTAILFAAVLSCGAGAGWTPEYALGDRGPGGGKIFYVSETGFGPGNAWHYLEAAPEDISSHKEWASAGSMYLTTSLPGTKTDIGTGAANTDTILAKDATAPAAEACKHSNYGGKTDWFLPSIDELKLMYQNRTFIDNLLLGGTDVYRSSSELSDTNAYSFRTFTGTVYTDQAKTSASAVRAIRAF